MTKLTDVMCSMGLDPLQLPLSVQIFQCLESGVTKKKWVTTVVEQLEPSDIVTAKYYS